MEDYGSRCTAANGAESLITCSLPNMFYTTAASSVAVPSAALSSLQHAVKSKPVTAQNDNVNRSSKTLCSPTAKPVKTSRRSSNNKHDKFDGHPKQPQTLSNLQSSTENILSNSATSLAPGEVTKSANKRSTNRGVSMIGFRGSTSASSQNRPRAGGGFNYSSPGAAMSPHEDTTLTVLVQKRTATNSDMQETNRSSHPVQGGSGTPVNFNTMK